MRTLKAVVLACFAFLAILQSAYAEGGPLPVIVKNPSTAPVPVTGNVGISGTPTVNIGTMPSITATVPGNINVTGSVNATVLNPVSTVTVGNTSTNPVPVAVTGNPAIQPVNGACQLTTSTRWTDQPLNFLVEYYCPLYTVPAGSLLIVESASFRFSWLPILISSVPSSAATIAGVLIGPCPELAGSVPTACDGGSANFFALNVPAPTTYVNQDAQTSATSSSTQPVRIYVPGGQTVYAEVVTNFLISSPGFAATTGGVAFSGQLLNQ